MFTISTRAITFTTQAKTKKYDGTALTVATDEILVSGEGWVGTEGSAVTFSTPTITNVGSVANTFTSANINWGTTNAANYSVTINSPETAILSVTKRNVVMTSGSYTGTYDGNAHVAENVSVTGDGFVDGEGATYTYGKSVTDVNEIANEFTYALNSGTTEGNYDIQTFNGVLKVTPITSAITVAITGHTATGVYDGTTRTATGYDVAVTGTDKNLYKTD